MDERDSGIILHHALRPLASLQTSSKNKTTFMSVDSTNVSSDKRYTLTSSDDDPKTKERGQLYERDASTAYTPVTEAPLVSPTIHASVAPSSFTMPRSRRSPLKPHPCCAHPKERRCPTSPHHSTPPPRPHRAKRKSTHRPCVLQKRRSLSVIHMCIKRSSAQCSESHLHLTTLQKKKPSPTTEPQHPQMNGHDPKTPDLWTMVPSNL